MRITPSSLRTWDACPKQLWYRDVQEIPTQDHDYYQYGRDCERHLYALLLHVLNHPAGVTFHTWEHQSEGAPGKEWARENLKSPEWRLANEMFKNRQFRTWIAEGGHLHLQPTLEKNGLSGHPDLVNDIGWVDAKTSKGPWNAETVREHKWQGKGYCYLSNKPGAFLVGNKSTFQAQFIRTESKKFEDLEEKVEALREAFKSGIFPATPSAAVCKARGRECSYANLCDRESIKPTVCEPDPSLLSLIP